MKRSSEASQLLLEDWGLWKEATEILKTNSNKVTQTDIHTFNMNDLPDESAFSHITKRFSSCHFKLFCAIIFLRFCKYNRQRHSDMWVPF